MTNHCTHEQSQRLKALGFDKPVKDYIYTGDTGNNINRYFHTLKADNHNADPLCISQPTPYEVLDWFRETKGMFGSIIMLTDGIAADWGFVIEENPYGYYLYDSIEHGRIYPTHPEALSALIDKLITILEEQKA